MATAPQCSAVPHHTYNGVLAACPSKDERPNSGDVRSGLYGGCNNALRPKF